MRKINWIVIHESDTPTGRPFTVLDIDSWHRARGFKRLDVFKNFFNRNLTSIGYQFVIYLDGSIHTGRSEEEIPAAVKNHNHDSVNICLIGKGIYSEKQWESLRTLVKNLELKYPIAVVTGHNTFDTAKEQGKTCPDFDVVKWVYNNYQPEAAHIYVSEE